jgi:putative ABC transport system substrate-binding protein
MTRRNIGFHLTLALAILVAPLAVEAKQAAKVPKLGVLSAAPPYSDDQLAVWRHAMRELGWVEGQNLEVVRRYAEGHVERLPALAAELIHLPVDLLYADGTPEALVAKQATHTIPIIMGGGDPVGLGIVESLARPGSNITGVSLLGPELASKHLELLREALPGVTRLALLTSGSPIEVHHMRAMEAVAPRLGLALLPTEARGPDDLDGAFATILTGRAEVLYVFSNGLIQQEIRRIMAFAAQHGLPVTGNRPWVTKAGGLMSYQHTQDDVSRRIAGLMDKVLRGAKPADLPMEQPMKFELIINLKTAKALGITISPTLLFQADEVIR